MAKVSDEEKVRSQLLDALRPAIDGAPHRLQGAGKPPGLFPGGQAGAKLIERARAESLIQEVASPEAPSNKKGKAKPPVYVILTERGRHLVLEKDNPAKILAGLRDGLTAQGTAFSTSLQDVLAELAAIRDTVERLGKSLATRSSEYQQTAQTLCSILDRTAHQSAPVAPHVAPPPPPAPSSAWLEEVVPFIAEQKRLNSFDRPNLKRVYEHLRKTHPTLTIGEFHEGLRTLHQQRRVRLDPYTQALATLMDPLHALYLDREVKYYVDLP
jgi:hypothetical protein